MGADHHLVPEGAWQAVRACTARLAALVDYVAAAALERHRLVQLHGVPFGPPPEPPDEVRAPAVVRPAAPICGDARFPRGIRLLGHDLVMARVDDGTRVVLCSRCGSCAAARWQNLARACGGHVVSAARTRQLNHAAAGRFPGTTAPTRYLGPCGGPFA